MRRELRSNCKGAQNLPLIVLFGVLLAWLMAFLFISIYDQQQNARVDERAETLANELAETAFTAFSGGQPILDLPRDLGGSVYAIEVQDNNTFVVRITGGRRVGNIYSAVVNATVTIENQDFTPGGRVYFMRSGDQIIVSAAPIEAPVENIVPVPTGEPPQFYYFARENQREAVAIAAGYFYTLELGHENIDASAYAHEGENILVQIARGGQNLFGIRVVGQENQDDVGKVDNAWIITSSTLADNLASSLVCSSPDNAYRGGWLYSRQGALDHLRSRTWRRVSDNVVVAVPAGASVQAAAATTNIWTYPTWQVKFEGYVIFYQMTPWWLEENMAGFVFQSEPELYPVV